MRLLYAYAEFLDRDGKESSHRGLSRLSLNFSTDRRFSYQNNTLTMTQMTQLEPPIPPVPPNFFGDRIYNVTTFVGDNGAGKTTILHYLIDLLRQFYESRYRGSDRGLLVAEDQGRTYLLRYGERPLRLDHIPDGFECVNLGEESNGLLSATKLIYLANTLTPSDLALMSDRPEKTDNRYVNFFHFRHDFLYNCSTVSLMLENCKNDSDNISDKPSNPAVEYLNCFFDYEQYKQVKYVFDKRQYGILEELKGKGYPVPVPKKLIVELQRMDHLDVSSRKNNFRLNKEIYLETLEEQYDWLAWELCNSCVITFIRTALLYIEEKDRGEYELYDLKEARKWLSSYDRHDNSKTKFLHTIEGIQYIYNHYARNRQQEKSLDLIQKVEGYCVDFINFIFEEKEHLRQYFEMEPIAGKTVRKYEHTITFAIKVTGEAAEWFITFLQKYRRIPCNSVLLWLDEADLTYHPEWQRRFLSILMAFLPKIYPETINEQIQDLTKRVRQRRRPV